MENVDNTNDIRNYRVDYDDYENDYASCTNGCLIILVVAFVIIASIIGTCHSCKNKKDNTEINVEQIINN